MNKINYNTIKEKLKEEYNLELISKRYVNSNKKLIYRDKYGYIYYSSWNNISQRKIASFADKRNIFAIRNIRRYIELNDIDVDLLSEKYEVNLKFRCKCGIIFERNWSNFKKNKQMCPKCALKIRGSNHRNDIKLMNNLFVENGYILNESIYSATQKVDCYNKDGYRGRLSYNKLAQQDTFDKFSFKNPYLYYNIQHFIETNDCTAKLDYIEKKQQFSKSILHLTCNCGNKYRSMWSTFSNNKVFKCPICSKKQSKYASLTEEYLKKNHIYYKKEYSFEDCRAVSKLFFDFALFIRNKMILVEVDGQYHFKDCYGDLESQQKRDRIKNQYCNNNNIPLIRIPYWEYKKDNYKNILDEEINKYIIESA